MSISVSTKRLLVHSGLAAVMGLVCITWLHIRPLGIIFLLTFFYWFYKNKIGFEVSAPEDFKKKVCEFTKRVVSMREESPSMFCGIACTVLGSVAVCGHLLSGSSIVLAALMASVLLSTKYNWKMFQVKKTEFKWPEKLSEHDMDEFLPEVNETTMDVLERASAQTHMVNTEDGDEKSDEIPTDLMIPDCIPEIDENSTDEDDALEIGVPEEGNERTKLNSDIEFKKRHFKKDSSISTSSSSDEENLSKGLQFPDHSKIDRSKKNCELGNQQSQSMIIASNVLPGLVSGLVSWASMTSNNLSSESFHQKKNNPSLSDDESDFEFVNTEEYQ